MITILTQRLLKYTTVVITKNRKKFLKERLNAPDIFYFAYGANLDPKRFEKYSMNAIPIGVAYLENYELDFGMPCEYIGKGYASIHPSEGKKVWGYLYKIDGLALTLLDIMEYAFLNHYRRIATAVNRVTGEKEEAFVYISGLPTQGLLPSFEYQSKIIEAGKKHGFPSEYIEHIKAFPSKAVFELDPGYSIIVPAVRRPFEKILRKPYLFHDKIREKLCAFLQF